nr:MAG TPA: cysteine-rich protein [Caudoviricetes sp.]
MKLEDIPKEELQEEAKFIEAVAQGLKQQPEGQIVLIDCPCGGKIKAIRSEYNGHRTTIAVCNRCKSEIRGSSGALESYERSGGR